MKLEDRIKNIKTLLKYCPHSTADVKIIEEKVGLFFGSFFNNDERFRHCRYSKDKIYPKISLHEENAFKGYEGSTIRIDYCYDFDRDGEDWTGYSFNDLTMLKYYQKYDFMKPRVLINYDEVPDYIWAIIQNELYEAATKNVNEKLESAKSTLAYWERKKEEFNTNLRLK